VRAGAVRLLAQGDPSRFPLFPDLPRIADTLPGFDVTGWFGFCLPRATPTAVIARWDDAIREAMQDARPSASAWTEVGLHALQYEGPEALATRLAADRAKWLDVIRAADVRVNDISNLRRMAPSSPPTRGSGCSTSATSSGTATAASRPTRPSTRCCTPE
jgi:hypothetical protein